MKKALIVLAFLGLAAPVAAQLPAYPYPNFTPGAVIASGEVNANFSIVADYGLKRNGGGLIEGHITVDPGITIDGADISAFLTPAGNVYSQVLGVVGTPAFSSTSDATSGMSFAAGALFWGLSGVEQMRLNASGLTVRGTNIFNNTGKIPALTTTYFVSVAADQLQLAETSFTDGVSLARLAADETITGTYGYTKGTIVASSPLSFTATWNNAGVTFKGVDLAITNTLSAAASRLWDVKLAGTSKIYTEVGGKTVVTALKVTGGAANGYFLVGDGSGTGTWTPSATAVPVPTGMIGFFEAACPATWTSRGALTELYNARFLRGAAAFDSTPQGADTHSHTVDPPNTASGNESVGHTHTVDIASGTVSATGAHEHFVNTITSGTGGGSHTHTFTTGFAGAVTTLGGAPGSTVGQFHTHSGTTDSTNIDHTHTMMGGGFFTSRNTDHAHTVDYPLTTSSGASATHTHSLDVASFASSTDSNVPAYVQVIVCKKD